ncbi:MAG: hypothetical protein EOO02_13460 [Chitinophagaceae bacterium]|nr:MAG: hypothetical protein EOO02_13460 [Chitinophagaceae bacterium]
MTKLFNHIMVPVDFSDVSELAIEKSIDIANHFKCNIHLVFTETPGLFSKHSGHLFSSLSGVPADAEARLVRLQNQYTDQLNQGLSIHSCIRQGNKNRSVIDYARRHRIDLVMVGRGATMVDNMFNRGFNINEITKGVKCPVITIREETGQDAWLNIVLPVCSALPIRKIMFASYLARKYNSRIHLLSIAGDENNQDADGNQYLHKSYQLLRENTNIHVECHTMRGHNIAEATMRFAEKINADLIVVNPGKETMLSGVVNKLFKGFLFNESKIPVMTISTAGIS